MNASWRVDSRNNVIYCISCNWTFKMDLRTILFFIIWTIIVREIMETESKGRRLFFEIWNDQLQSKMYWVFNISDICRKPRGKKHEVYIIGGSPCQRTCRELYCTCCIKRFWQVNGFFCKKGYARNTDGECIKISSPQCRRGRLSRYSCPHCKEDQKELKFK